MSLSATPAANRLHIGIYGKCNSGKSSLINALTRQNIALVSPHPGTTTDPVYKAMEIHGIGPCMFIDTAGFDDEGELGQLRMSKTREAAEKTDIAVILCCQEDLQEEKAWLEVFKARKTPVLAVINKGDILEHIPRLEKAVQEELGLAPLVVSSKTGAGISRIREALIRNLPEDFAAESITRALVSPEDIVLLVMPQDIQAPKGRLILPQVQTIRDLLDNRCLVFCTTTENLDLALSALVKAPKLIIADSQVFKTVYAKKPPESLLTSFSVLFAAYKGQAEEFAAGAAALDDLEESDRVLIAEACTHAPMEEDIGREKIPRLLRQKIGENLKIDMVSGQDFPEDLSPYALIIHCGACMFNRKYVLSRITKAKSQGVPITNYGIVLAKLTGILDKIVY